MAPIHARLPLGINQFTCSLVGNTEYLRNFQARPGIAPRTSGFVVQGFPHHTSTPLRDPRLVKKQPSCPKGYRPALVAQW